MSERWIIDPLTHLEVLARKGETDEHAYERHRAGYGFKVAPPATASSDERQPRTPRTHIKLLTVFSGILLFGLCLIPLGTFSPWLSLVGALVALAAGIPLAAIMLYAFCEVTFKPHPTLVSPNTPSGRQYGDAFSRLSESPIEWRDAEERVASWMRANGASEAKKTRGSHDYGVDVESDGYVAQVKHWQSNVGAPAVREIFGTAQARRKQALVFTKTGYTRDAKSFADDAGVALFTYSQTGEARPANVAAERVLLSGL